MKRVFFSLLLLHIMHLHVAAQPTLPAFPSAEGAGMYTTGGRGGVVYYVNTLEDTKIGNKKTQEGSLRWCLSQKSTKTILFKVAGIIHLTATLNISANTTIAGQSAPGDGICLAGYPVKVSGDNVILRFLRFRMGDVTKITDDALSAKGVKNVIIDHCSMSWSTDECASFYDNENFTLQWSILSESLRKSVHAKGEHGYGGIWGGKKASFHHNLLAHHDSRNPRLCGSRYSNQPELELVDLRNNVIYNWGINSAYAGEGGRYNFVNNYYKPTAQTVKKTRIVEPYGDDGKNKQPEGVWGVFFVDGNVIENNASVSNDNWLGVHPHNRKEVAGIKSTTVFELLPVTTDKAEVAYQKVLDFAGASFKRDSTDRRVAHEVINGLTPIRASGGGTTKPGMIDSQEDVGSWDCYKFDPKEVVVDANLDGVPDRWMATYYPQKSGSELTDSGYTVLDHYLNSLVQEIITKESNFALQKGNKGSKSNHK